MTLFRILIATALVAGATMIGGGVANGVPTYWCFGQAATIVGTPGDDRLEGRADTADVIVGLGGDDIIFGTEDDGDRTSPGDRLCGGPGADYVKGSFGADRIQGGRDDDYVDGSFGYDLITKGGPGNDLVEDCDSEYTGGVRWISGGAGDDQLCVDTDSAHMYGNSGNDLLVDFNCTTDSRLSGGIGDDRLESYFSNEDGMACVGFADADEVRGGAGQDVALVNQGDLVTDAETVERDPPDPGVVGR